MTKDSREKVSAFESVWDNKFFNIPPGEDFAYALVRGLEDRLKAEGKKGTRSLVVPPLSFRARAP